MRLNDASGMRIFSETIKSLYHGANLNLVDCEIKNNPFNSNTSDYEIYFDLTCELVVLEPEFLIDISSLAECFREYGAHPYNYFMSRLSADANSAPLILGNIANQFLDDIINETPDSPASYNVSMTKAFANNPLAVASCPELDESQKERDFFNATRTQFQNIRTIVDSSFSGFEIDCKNVLIEPSFICVALGLQGRLDMLQQDFRKFIELKSGRAQEAFAGSHFTYKENNYVQMLLYYAVLNINLGLGINDIDAFLFYSKYPVLLPLPYSRNMVRQAINIRNIIVSTEKKINDNNNPDFSRTIISAINANNLNVRKENSSLWNRFQKPQIDNFAASIESLSVLEQEYYMSVFTFITKEQFVSKTGDFADEMNRGVTMLWNNSVKEKAEAGEIITPLFIKEAYPEKDHHIVKFIMPEANDESIPNFRKGDAIIFYQQKTDESNVCNSQIFKASIEKINTNEVIASLRFIQRNESVLPHNAPFTIERDYLDASYTAMYKGLSQFVNATQERRSLILGERSPGASGPLKQEYENDIERIADKALSAKDYFLLIGPPGTGKTSVALRRMVSDLYNDPYKNILLLAYTNKAVDEICHSISSLDDKIPFIRIGSESTCDEKFKDNLLRNLMSECKNRLQVRNLIAGNRVYVATVSTISRQTDLFRLKSFDVAIIDEASQIIEPQILSLLCAKGKDNKDAVRKFILIGDHKQLPAVVLQSEEAGQINNERLNEKGINNFRDSFFERLYRNEQKSGRTQFMDMLTKQGRMHPEIADFPGKYFYDEQLKCVPLEHQNEESNPYFGEFSISEIAASNRFCFISVAKKDYSLSDKVNPEEASLVARLVKECIEAGYKKEPDFNPLTRIGIITPYRNQIAMIKKEISLLGIPDSDSFAIDTVERFQGGQRDIMIYSCCVAKKYQLQFLSNCITENGKSIDRKLNVALTRARKQMFIVGDHELLSNDSVYKELIEFTKSKKQFWIA